MKKFIFVSMLSTAALSLAACEPTADETVVAPEEAPMEAPMEAPAGAVMPIDDTAAVDGMEADGMEGAEMSEDDERGNPVDRAPAAN